MWYDNACDDDQGSVIADMNAEAKANDKFDSEYAAQEADYERRKQAQEDLEHTIQWNYRIDNPIHTCRTAEELAYYLDEEENGLPF